MQPIVPSWSANNATYMETHLQRLMLFQSSVITSYNKFRYFNLTLYDIEGFWPVGI